MHVGGCLLPVRCTDIYTGLITADTLSRAPAKHTFTQKEKDNEAVFVDVIIQTLPATERRLKIIQENQKVDPVCAKLIRYCEKGWPEKHNLPTSNQTIRLFFVLHRGSPP